MSSNISDLQQSTKKNELVSFFPSHSGEKRQDYLEWGEYFMAVTFLELQKSENQSQSDVAIILNQRQIIISIAKSDFPNDKNTADLDSYIYHAEYKALEKIQEGVTLYTTSFPCEKCAHAIVGAGILEIIYYHDSVNMDVTSELLKQGGVSYRQFVSKKKRIEIDFSEFCDN